MTHHYDICIANNFPKPCPCEGVRRVVASSPKPYPKGGRVSRLGLANLHGYTRRDQMERNLMREDFDDTTDLGEKN